MCVKHLEVENGSKPLALYIIGPWHYDTVHAHSRVLYYNTTHAHTLICVHATYIYVYTVRTGFLLYIIYYSILNIMYTHVRTRGAQKIGIGERKIEKEAPSQTYRIKTRKREKN
jgi:hypothetical protein